MVLVEGDYCPEVEQKCLECRLRLMFAAASIVRDRDELVEEVIELIAAIVFRKLLRLIIYKRIQPCLARTCRLRCEHH